MTSINKDYLVVQIHQETGLAKNIIKQFIDSILANLSQALQADEKVQIINFGTWYNLVKQERPGFNPMTQEPHPVSARTTIGFKPAIQLKSLLNQS